jgi:hypothetical protein
MRIRTSSHGVVAAGFIMEVFYPDWLANPVLVLKKNNTWRMCIDYTSLKKLAPRILSHYHASTR